MTRKSVTARRVGHDVDTARSTHAEIARLRRLWNPLSASADDLGTLFEPDALAALDPFDRAQLAYVVSICRTSRSLSEAGRTLFAVSRMQRSSANDADRLRKYLARFDLSWQRLAG